MNIQRSSFDDLLNEVLKRIIKSGHDINPTKDRCREVLCARLTLTNPRSRFSLTDNRDVLFSALGEYLWYVSGSNDLSFISYYVPRYSKYSDDGMTLAGAYGPRIFGNGLHSQFETIASILKRKRDTRQAVIPILAPQDIVNQGKDVPCTASMQFLLRRDKLDLIVYMRSSDVYLGFAHDVFCFTMIQEMMAAYLNVKLGRYYHVAGSLHLYERDFEKAKRYLAQGYQPKISMPSMPSGSPWTGLQWLSDVAANFRNEKLTLNTAEAPQPYWCELAKILQAKAYEKLGNNDALKSIVAEMDRTCYSTFLRARDFKAETDSLEKGRSRVAPESN